MDGRGLLLDLLGSHGEFFGRLVLALGVNDLGAFFALGFRLPRHRALHHFRKIYALDLYKRNFDSPRTGMEIKDLLQAMIELFALAQQIIQSDFA